MWQSKSDAMFISVTASALGRDISAAGHPRGESTCRVPQVDVGKMGASSHVLCSSNAVAVTVQTRSKK